MAAPTAHGTRFSIIRAVDMLPTDFISTSKFTWK